MLGGMSWFVDFREVARHLLSADWRFVLLGLLAHYATYPVRGYRWKRCLSRSPVSAGTARFALVVFFYQFVNNLVPAKLGDFYGAHLAWINFGIARSAALGAGFFLRMIDAWVVLALALFGSWALFSSSFPAPVAWGIGGGVVLAITISAVLLTFALLNRSVPHWVPERGRQMIEAFHGGMRPPRRETGRLIASTFVIWGLETLWIYLLLRGFGVEFGIPRTVFVAVLPLLATAFPLTPSGVGVVEVTLLGCLHLVGVPPPLAASITVLNRFIDYWLHVAMGFVIWGIRQRVGLQTWRHDSAKMAPSGEISQVTIGQKWR